MAYLLVASAVSNLDWRVVHGILRCDTAPHLTQVRNQGNVRLEDRLVKQRVCATNLPGRDENRQDEVNCFTGDFVCVRACVLTLLPRNVKHARAFSAGTC